MNTILKNGSPESVGISSRSIINALEEISRKGIPMHSFLLCRHEILAAEGYYAPCTQNSLHRMFSVTKSFVSVAIGLLEEDGLLSLDDSITAYFPEYVPANPHPWLVQTTIRDMLSMRSCHASTTYNKFSTTENWVESFFITPPTHKPGTVFHYDTSATHTLCALAEKLTGMPLLDYLRSKILDDIGFSREAWCLKDPFGVSMGGSGLMATSRDLLLFSLLILHEGKLGGKQYVPASYIRKATRLQTATCVTGPIPSESQGYGYQFWIGEHETIVCYGMGGQLAILFPRFDTVIVTTADTQGYQGGNQVIYDAVFRHILPELTREQAPWDAPEADMLAFRSFLSGLSLQPLTSSHPPVIHPAARYRLQEHALFKAVSFETDMENGCCIFHTAAGERRIDFGFGRVVSGTLSHEQMNYAASAAWLSDCCLYIRIHLLDTSVGSIHIQAVFGKNDVTIFMRKQEETLFNEYTGHLYGIL